MAAEPVMMTAGNRAEWGPGVRTHGYTCFPNALFRHYAQLGISAGELVLLQQLWTYWWDEHLPYPALGVVAARMGKTVRQIQGYIHSLRTRGLLLVIRRADSRGRQLANAYDLRPLLAALDEIAPREVRMQRSTNATPAQESSCPRVHDLGCDRLCLIASSAAEAAWLDRVLRRRIEEVLADLEYSGCAVSFAVANAPLDHLLPATAT